MNFPIFQIMSYIQLGTQLAHKLGSFVTLVKNENHVLKSQVNI